MTVSLRSDFAKAANPAPARKETPPRPISVRVTHEERAALEKEAGAQTLSAYIRSVLFDSPGTRRKSVKRPDLDRVALARILALLGQSELAASLKMIAGAARTGTLECGPDLLTALREASVDIAFMRADLIRAIGIKAD
jgi:hypothetical protein